MSVLSRGKDTWRIQVYTGKDASGKWIRHSETFHGKSAEARQRERDLLTSVNRDTYVPPTKRTVADLLHLWLDTYVKAKCDLRTQEGHETIVRKFLIPEFGTLSPKQLTTERIEQFYVAQLGRVKGNTVRHYHQTLSQALHFAAGKGLTSRNPCDYVSNLPAFVRPDMRTLVPIEVDGLNDAGADSYYYPAIYFTLSSGVRQGEALALRWRDLDLDMATISVSRAMQARKVRERGITFKEPKTRRSRRSIPMTPKLVLFLKEYRGLREATYLGLFGRRLALDDLVFTSQRFEPLNPSVLSHNFTRLIKKAGLEHVRFHDLRHTFASLLLRQHVAPKIIQEALGHHSVAFTMDTYSHIMENMAEEAMARLNATLPGSVPQNYNTKIAPKRVAESQPEADSDSVPR